MSTIICPNCHGKGMVLELMDIPCIGCKGTGRDTVNNIPCVPCKGTGRTKLNFPQTCKRCGGIGKINL